MVEETQFVLFMCLRYYISSPLRICVISVHLCHVLIFLRPNVADQFLELDGHGVRALQMSCYYFKASALNK